MFFFNIKDINTYTYKHHIGSKLDNVAPAPIIWLPFFFLYSVLYWERYPSYSFSSNQTARKALWGTDNLKTDRSQVTAPAMSIQTITLLFQRKWQWMRLYKGSHENKNIVKTLQWKQFFKRHLKAITSHMLTHPCNIFYVAEWQQKSLWYILTETTERCLHFHDRKPRAMSSKSGWGRPCKAVC